MKPNTPLISRVVNSFCLQQPLSRQPPPFHQEGLMLLLPTGHDILSWSEATHKMLMSWNLVTHASSHLFFFTVYSTASILLVWRRPVQIQDVLPLFTLNNKLSLPYFSQWFKSQQYCKVHIYSCKPTYQKNNCGAESWCAFQPVSLSEMPFSMWIKQEGGNGKVLQELIATVDKN